MASLSDTTLRGPSIGYGLLPVGAIIPMSTLTGAYSLPASGTVDSYGWMRCDGAAIPSGKTLSGNTPDLSDGRFLRGNTTSGSTGGATSVTLATENLPSHTHTGPAHTHTIDHNHPSVTSGSNSVGHYHYIARSGQSGGLPGSLESDNYASEESNFPTNYYSYYALGGTTSSPNVGRTSGVSANHSHDVDLPNYTGNSGSAGDGNTGSTGSGLAFSIIPKYLDVVFLIRVQ